MRAWTRKHLLGLQELSEEEITVILDTAAAFKGVSSRRVKKVPALQGKTIVNLFLEPSTRTRISFELAAKRLSADVVSISRSSSSITKGETLKDTALNIQALNVDLIVIRHAAAGAPHFLARFLESSVVNAGDGAHEHPTQALLDLFTMREKLGRIEGLRVTILGDILYSRVARSNIWGLTKLGAHVTVAGPPTLIPQGIERLGVRVCYELDAAIRDADVINLLRIQHERQREVLFPSIGEYAAVFGLTRERLRRVGHPVLIMHPGPINRGVELSSELADGEESAIIAQVTNGLAVRMAVLFLVSGGTGPQGVDVASGEARS